jgi:subtilisin family serine protease
MSDEEEERPELYDDEALIERENEAVRKASKGHPGVRASKGSMMKTLAVAIAIIIIAAIIWQVFLGGGTRSDWAYEMTQMNEANDQGYTGKGIRVAVIDTGIDADHEAFDGVDIVEWKDFVNGKSKPYDDEGHGTSMTSIIAGQSAMPGGAKDVELIIVKVLDQDGIGTDALIADGVLFAIDPNDDGDYSDGADVISMSLGGRTSYLASIIGTESMAAIEEAVKIGVLVIAAAGNDGEDDDGDVSSPGWIKDVVCVGAVDKNSKRASFSSIGRNLLKTDPDRKPEVVTPGVQITTAKNGGGYKTGSGTSQATAFMAACLAIVLSVNPDYAHDGIHGGSAEVIKTVKEAIMESSKTVSGQKTPHDNYYGYGLVQVVDMIEYLQAL